jgi:hypothetical protein
MSRAPRGKAIEAAKVAVKSDATIKKVAELCDVSEGSLRCAARRMGIKLRMKNPDRNTYFLRKAYFFRVRTKDLQAFWHLGKDIEKARAMRDRLERFFDTL